MKTKLLSVFLVILALLSSCQSDYFEMQNDESSLNSCVVSRSIGFTFPDGWQHLETNEERWATLQIPERLFTSLSTEELVEACMSYPLALDCYAFNNVQYGISEVTSRFNGFAKLKQREDAFDKVLDFYSRKLDEIELFGNTAGYTFKPLSLSFYERFIVSGYLLPTEDLKNSDKLVNLYYKADEIHNSFEELQGQTLSESISSLKESLNIDSKTREIASYTLVTIYTPKGLPVIALKNICKDMAAEEKEGLNFIEKDFPRAQIIDEATCAYNCHAYAWYISEGGKEYWIDQYYEDNDNVSNFWNDGTYKETHMDFAQKIYYPVGDHSAVAETPITYISKWGRMPLVRHASNYGPYNRSELKYFTKDFTAPGINEPPYKIGKVYWDMFPDPTPINTYEDFHINESYNPNNYRTEIFITGGKDPDEPLEK